MAYEPNGFSPAITTFNVALNGRKVMVSGVLKSDLILEFDVFHD